MPANNRLDTIVSDLVASVRRVMEAHDVTFEEYRAALDFFLKTAEAGEIPLLVDVFFNTTIAQVEGRMYEGSTPSIEGPYYLENIPEVTDRLATREQDCKHTPMIVRGRVTDESGRPLAGAAIDIWHSTPDGLYSGIHEGIPIECYRGRVRTDAEGRYDVRSIQPVPYQIPHHGPTGALLDAMGRHSWRPAHIHYKITHPGMHTHISQAYFEGGAYVGDDCCEDRCEGHVVAEAYENGARIVEMDFRIAPERVAATAA
jgi:catechol 1,2-dioxygenase/chlorocatechol 1,2-dioxygenase